METTYVVLIALLVIYIPLYIYVRKSEKAHEKGFVPYGPTIMIRTRWGLKLMDRLAKYKRFWHFMGTVSLVVAFILAMIIVTILLIDLSVIPNMFGKKGMGIEYALAIPGLNPILPLSYGIIGLVFAMVIHEMAHGIQSRANDIKVNSSGILYGVVPLGAFVEPDEEETEKASRRARMHVYAAGITVNTFAALILFAIMMFSMTNCMSCDYSHNAAVYSIVSDTEAYNLDIPTTSILVKVNGQELDSEGLSDYLRLNHSENLQVYHVTFLYKGDEITRDMPLGVCVSSITADSPAEDIGMQKGMFITALSDGANTSYINVPGDFSEFMNGTTPGQTISVTYCTYSSGTLGPLTTVPVTLTSNGDVGFFGVATTISGISFTTPQIILDKGINPLYGREGLQQCALGLLAYVSQPFQGFSPVPESVTWWYHSNIGNDDVFWVIMWIVYWCFWLDIVLGISNALPAVPFDGGLLLFGAADWLYEKFGVVDKKKRDEYVNKTCSLISYMMIFIMILVIVVIVI